MATPDTPKTQIVLEQLRKQKTLPAPLPPIEHLSFAVLVDGVDDETDARNALRKLQTSFVNWNECRVARRTEIARILDALPDPDERALRLRVMLNKIFDFGGSMTLDPVAEMKPSDARRALVNIETNIPRDIIAIIQFRLCPGTTLPISPEALKEARKQGLIGRSGTKQQLQKVLIEELNLLDAGELVLYLETLSASEKPKKTTQKKAAKKTGTKAKAATTKKPKRKK